MKRCLHLLLSAICVVYAYAYDVAERGAWCWFADPRAVHNVTPDGRTNMTYIGYIDNLGNINAVQYDFNGLNSKKVLVRSYFQPDDHNNPTFLVIPDGRVMVFYSRHTDEPCFYYRISNEPADITTLGEEHIIHTDHNTTYPSPFILSDDPDHFYLCWRGINWHPTIARFTLPDRHGKVSLDFGPYQIVQSTGARPYAKYASDGKNKILMAYTTGHPDNEDPNYLYYNYIDINDMGLYDVNGKRVASIADGPMHVDKSEEFGASHPCAVVDASPYRDWVWQLAIDRNSHPLIAMTRISKDKKSHNYYIAKWNGKEWKKSHIAHAGGHFHQSPEIEHCYSAGMAIDPDDTRNVYCSVPVVGENGRVYEIIKYRLDDNGEVVSSTAITSNSAKNNVRPYCISGTSDSPLRLVWMQGDYYDWIVSEERPLGFDTSMCCDFYGFYSDESIFGNCLYDDILEARSNYKFDGKDFYEHCIVNIDQTKPEDVLLDFGRLKYVINNETLVPEIRFDDKVYRSTNKVASSESWKRQPRSTNGKWYDPVPLNSILLEFIYEDGVVTTKINELVDQRVRIAPSTKPKRVFEVENPDYTLSPSTGLNRKHWIQAGEYLLDGAFRYISKLDDPMFFPKQLDKTYPHGGHDIKVAKLEGLARTFFLAAPLLRENPELTLNDIRVADYYRHQLLGLITEGSSNYERPYTNSPTQTLLELASLCISLELTKDLIWDSFTPEQRDAFASLFKAYGEGPTINSNWRFFNVFALSFLKEHGYEVNEKYLEENIADLLSMYRGAGWYNDAPAYDYYSMWAFQTYGPLWAHLFGEHQYPDFAKAFYDNQAALPDFYPYMFAHDGCMNMYGRSIPYRFACVAPFGVLEYGNRDDINYGWLRKISSASLLQFLQNPDFLDNYIPTMGFYGEFAPATQIYSCRGSVFWMGKAFFNLLLPEDSAYWTAVENDGAWADLDLDSAINHYHPVTNVMITNYPNCGGSEFRAICHESVASDWQKFRSSENYNKLAYHTEFPWMADCDGIVSMNYATLNGRGDWEVLRLYHFNDFSSQTYCRDAVLETDSRITHSIAEYPLADGVLHFDVVTVPEPTKVRLGSYSLPDLGKGFTQARDSCAYTLSNGEYQLAVVPISGWNSTFVAYPEGVHPVSDRCGLIVSEADVEGTKLLISLHLWQKGDQPISEKLLHQVKDISLDSESISVIFEDGSHCSVPLRMPEDVKL